MWPNLQETADLVTFTEEILNGKLRFLCSGKCFSFEELLQKDGSVSIDHKHIQELAIEMIKDTFIEWNKKWL